MVESNRCQSLFVDLGVNNFFVAKKLTNLLGVTSHLKLSIWGHDCFTVQQQWLTKK